MEMGGPGIAPLSRPGARCRDCSRPVSPDLSPNPPCASQRNGLSTVSAVRRGSQGAMGWGSCWPWLVEQNEERHRLFDNLKRAVAEQRPGRVRRLLIRVNATAAEDRTEAESAVYERAIK